MRMPIGGTPGALYHIPGPVGIVPLNGPTSCIGGGAPARTRAATSSPRRLPAVVRSARDPARPRSRASSAAIETRTAESVYRLVSTAAEAAAAAASAERVRAWRAEFTAADCAALSSAYTGNSIGGGLGARRLGVGESPAAAAAFLAARRLAAF